jgi:phage shock protein E
MAFEQECRELSPRECYQFIAHDDSCMIIDVRTGEEFSRGHLEGAENIDYFLPDFAKRLERRDRTISYVVYCRKGHRGKKAMELMRKCGFSRVINISGGFEEWESLGLPIERLG